jgi:hypothetical protein
MDDTVDRNVAWRDEKFFIWGIPWSAGARHASSTYRRQLSPDFRKFQRSMKDFSYFIPP